MGFVKGQKAYVHSRDSRNADYETTVVSIGKKFITCQENDGWRKQRFSVETLRDDDWINYELYESKAAYEDKCRIAEIMTQLHWDFDKKIMRLNESQLNRIAEILNEVK